jgi:hypothetical protein
MCRGGNSCLPDTGTEEAGAGISVSQLKLPQWSMKMRDIDTRDGWKQALEATLPLVGSLLAFLLLMAVR